MANVKDDLIAAVTFRADVALNAKQYYCVAAASTVNYVKVATGGSNPVPIGIVQDDTATSIGMPVEVKCWGFSKAVVAACDCLGGNTCAVGFGDFLHAGSDGKLYVSGSGNDTVITARAFETITSGSAIILVYFMPSPATACAAS